MANLSDAFGTIRVEKVGKEFLEFLSKVQGEKSDAYYTLVDRENLADNLHAVDDEGNLEMGFSAFGRWSYVSNIRGYLQGGWMNISPDKEAYNEFVEALKEKQGVVSIEYVDSDPAMDWMGKGLFVMDTTEGRVDFQDHWKEEPISITGYANMHDEDPLWALGYLSDEDAPVAFEEYLERCKKKGIEPKNIDDWYENVYETE